MVNELSDDALAALRAALLDWYDASGRVFAWRVSPAARAQGARADPYRVWLSEVMLQQTTTAAAGPYFERFVERFPDVCSLAAAPEDEVLRLWAGLGYYSRARNLHKAAKAIAAAGGRFPDTEAGLRALPGVGPYTAAAIAAIAFDRPAAAVDGNIERVASRVFAVETPLPAARPALKALAARLLDPARPGDFTQALMDLGATVCAPKAPKCLICPVALWCAGRKSGAPETYGRKAARASKPERRGLVYWLEREGQVWLVRRAGSGLLGGMAALPTSAWTDGKPEMGDGAPAAVDWRALGSVRHVFTHFALTLEVLAGAGAPHAEGWWAEAARIEAHGLPSVFLKAARLARAADQP